MNKRVWVAAVLFVLGFTANACAFDEGDFQYWNTESISWEVAQDWQMTVEEEFRFGDDASKLFYQHTDLGVLYGGLADWFDIGFNYRLVFEEEGDEWQYENRPHLNLTVKGDAAGFAVSNRGRFEFREREKSADGWRYRNKLSVKLPWKLTSLEVQPYVADEIFVDFKAAQLDRNRLYFGVAIKVVKNLKAEIFHLWQTSKSSSGKWTDANVVGSKLKLVF